MMFVDIAWGHLYKSEKLNQNVFLYSRFSCILRFKEKWQVRESKRLLNILSLLKRENVSQELSLESALEWNKRSLRLAPQRQMQARCEVPVFKYI